MASGLYDAAKKKLLDADLDLLVLDVRVQLIDSADYTENLATDDFLDDVAAGARVGPATALASRTTTAGVFDAADTTLISVTGDPIEALIIYNHTGVDSTADLIAFVDGLTLTPNGNDVIVQWDDGANKIFSI